MTQARDSSDIWVVIPNLNNAALLRTCLDALLAQISADRVIVVDNGSTDNSVEVALGASKDIVIIKHAVNKGFTGGVNAGLEYALKEGAEYIVLLNNDAVVQDNWLKSLVGTAERNQETGIVTSKILLDDGKHIDSTGDFMTVWGVPFPRGRHEIDSGQYDNQTDVFGASGGASLYRAVMLREIGLFDDDYFAYLEDVDISFRAQAAGWKVLYEPKAIVYHALSKTSSALGKDFAFYHFVKNFMLLYARNMPLKLYFKYLLFFKIHFLRLFVSSLKHRRPHVFFSAVTDALKLHGNTVYARRRNKKLRKLSSDEIDALLLKQLPPRPPRIN